MRYPKAQIILSHKNFFGYDAPSDRVSLIKHIPKMNVVTEILALNYRLKPANQLHVDSSYQTQIRELMYFTGISKDLSERYLRLYANHNYVGYSAIRENHSLIFTREGCLYAIEEILNSDEFIEVEDFDMAEVKNWKAIIDYLISVNSEVTKYIDSKDEDDLLESINSKLISLNESTVEISLVFVPYRATKLMKFILSNSFYEYYMNSYFKKKYSMSPEEFIIKILQIYTATRESEFQFSYHVRKNENFLFNSLSERFKNTETHKLIGIRKSPFIKIDEEHFLISDVGFLLEKLYSQFINDFWFDYLKHEINFQTKKKFEIKSYKSIIGYFFEKYVKDIFDASFVNYKYSKLLMFDELKVITPNGQVEIADIYLRYNNKIVLGQVKSSSIYDDQKFGGDITSLYRGNREAFFKNFGVDQLIQSIINTDELITKIDKKFPKGHSYVIYPVIIVNEKALQNPLMSEIFNKRFQELVHNINIKKVRIRPLSLICVNELERLETVFSSKPQRVWELLEYHTKFRKFISSFSDTLNHFFIGYDFSSRIRDEYIDLLKEIKEKYGINF